jgi:hypothetical protein
MAKKSTYDDDDDEPKSVSKSSVSTPKAEIRTGDEEEEADEPGAGEEPEEAAAPAARTVKAELQEHSVTLKTKDDINGVVEGMSVSGDGITAGTAVSRIDAKTGAVVMTQSATKSGTDVEVRIG